MNDFERFLHATPKEGSQAGGQVEELLKAAGARPEMPAEDFAAIKQAARDEWQSLVQRQESTRNRWGWGLAMAASLILALVVGWWWQEKGGAPVGASVATVLRVEGDVKGPEGRPLEVGAPLPATAEIVTGEGGRVALLLAGGESVRLDLATRVRLAAGDRLALDEGAIYFDSAGAADHAGIQVATEFGTVRDIGTRFEVRIDRGASAPLRVRVRDGAVALDRDGASHAAEGGQELRLESDGAVTLAEVSAYGEEWSWVLAAAPAFEIDGETLSRYLEWVSRETGWTVEFEDPTLAASASTILLGGTIEALTADESVRVILPGSGMDYRIEEGTLYIFAARGR